MQSSCFSDRALSRCVFPASGSLAERTWQWIWYQGLPCSQRTPEFATMGVRTQLGCKYRPNEFNDLCRNVFGFLQLIFELKCKNRRLVLTLIASRQQSVLPSLHLPEKHGVAGQ